MNEGSCARVAHRESISQVVCEHLGAKSLLFVCFKWKTSKSPLWAFPGGIEHRTAERSPAEQPDWVHLSSTTTPLSPDAAVEKGRTFLPPFFSFCSTDFKNTVERLKMPLDLAGRCCWLSVTYTQTGSIKDDPEQGQEILCCPELRPDAGLTTV